MSDLNQQMKNLRMAYDREGDVLDISLGESKEAISREIEDDLFIRINPQNNEVVGISILNFEKENSKRSSFSCAGG